MQSAAPGVRQMLSTSSAQSCRLLYPVGSAGEFALSPAMKTLGLPLSRTLRKMVLNAFTALALAGPSWQLPARSRSPRCGPVPVALKGLLMSTMTLPARASPYSRDDRNDASYNRAIMTMFPAGAAPHLRGTSFRGPLLSAF
jgi:hypothetical protein